VAHGIERTAGIDAAAFAVAFATTDLVEPRVARRDLLTHTAGRLAGATTVDRRIGWRRRQGTETGQQHPNEKAGERAKRG
jgi:hypothetical protein